MESMNSVHFKMQYSNTAVFRVSNDNGTSSASLSDQLAHGVEQVASESTNESTNSITHFFAVGLLINILMIAAYFIWAYRQWNKKKGEDNN